MSPRGLSQNRRLAESTVKAAPVLALAAMLASCAQLPQESLAVAAELATPLLGGTKAFLGVLSRPATIATHAGRHQREGILVQRVVPDSAADRAGLRGGDLIVAIDRQAVSDTPAATRTGLLASRVQGYQPGERLQLELLRPERNYRTRIDGRSVTVDGHSQWQQLLSGDQNRALSLERQVRWRALRFAVVLGQRAKLLQLSPTNPLYELPPDRSGRWLKPALRHFDMEADYLKMLAKWSDPPWWRNHQLLPLVSYLRREPLRMDSLLEELRVTLRRHAGHPAALVAALAALRAGRADSPPTTVTPPAGVGATVASGATAELARVSWLLERAHSERQRALRELDSAALRRLHSEAPTLFAALATSYYLHSGDDLVAQQRSEELLALLARIDEEAMASSLLWLARLAELEPLQRLANALDGATPLREAVPGASGQLLYAATTSAGRIVVGGRGENRYTGRFALVIDLGGDDVYLNATGRVDGELGAAAILDLGGDDEYSATADFAQGGALLGVALLMDLSGDDRYRATRFAQGTTIGGGALLVDWDGDDEYSGEEYLQGTAFFGLAALVDGGGDDLYHGNQFAQGVGGPRAVGLLLDRGGDDRYFCGGRELSSYGTGGVFRGSGQGLGIGLRFYAAGGIGLLQDEGGRDQLQAGNFAQGTGYYYALGALFQGGTEDDRYLASRYGQGSAAHNALGAMIEDGGNDRYRSTFAGVVQAAAWDRSAALFIDRGGDDHYGRRPLHFAQGTAAVDSVALFIDGGGDDTYQNLRAQRGWDERDRLNFGFFADLGAGDNHYLGFKPPSAPPGISRGPGRHTLWLELPVNAEALRAAPEQWLLRARLAPALPKR